MVGGEGEGVFGVELHLVNFEPGEEGYELFERMDGRNFAATDIKHETAGCKVGIIVNGKKGQLFG